MPSSAAVLVADDNPILLQGLERALSATGYSVQTATTGALVLELLERSLTPPDLLLLDVMMPELSGLEVLRRVQADARWADLPVMLITAANDDELPVTALQDGAVDFLTKPFRLGELIARVQVHVARSRDLRRTRAAAQRRLNALNIVRDLHSVVSADEMFRLVTGRVAESWRVARCSVFLDEGDGAARVLASSAGEPPAGELVWLDDYPEIGIALDGGEPVLVGGVQEPSGGAAAAELDGDGPPTNASDELGSVLAVPVAIAEHARGIFHVRSAPGEPTLDAEALALARQLADGMSLVLGRAQVLESLVEQRRQLHDLVHVDELTGCATRRAVLRYLGEELDLARRRKLPIAVVLFDLDRFRDVNATYGHAAGDAVLRSFGEWLRSDSTHRHRDCAGRYGGDEFVVVLPDTAAEGALCFAERGREFLGTQTFIFPDGPMRTSLSAGIAAVHPAEIGSLDELLEAADAALFQAKQAGRDCIRLAENNGAVAG